MEGRLAYGNEISLRSPIDHSHPTPVVTSAVIYGCDNYVAAPIGFGPAPIAVESNNTERGCLGCLIDGYDHNCGYVGLAGLFGSRTSRRRR